MDAIKGQSAGGGAHLILLCLVQSSFKGGLLRDVHIRQLLQLFCKAHWLLARLLQSLIEIVALVVPHERSLLHYLPIH